MKTHLISRSFAFSAIILVALALLPDTVFGTFSANNAEQYRADTGAIIPDPSGTIPTGVGVYFDCAATDTTGATIQMQVELQQLPATWTGTPNYSSPYVASGGRPRTSTAIGLTAGNYGWRFRVVNSSGITGIWVAANNPDFIVQGANQVTLTLYVHSGSASGPLLSGALVTGSDGAGKSFNQTTGSAGYVTITGTSGTWQFTASGTGYSTTSWNESINFTETLNAFLTANPAPTMSLSNPNAGTTWQVGTSQTVGWSVSGDTSQISYFVVRLSTDNGVSYTDISANLSASTRSFNYTPTSGQATTIAVCWVRAFNSSGTALAGATSSGAFIIAASCSYSLSSYNASANSSSSSSSFNVTSGGGCSWTANTSYSWIHTSSSGNGSGSVNYAIDGNATGSSRSGTITLQGQTFTITQTANTTSTSPLYGKGDWIHNISSAIAAVPGATTVQDLINYEKSIGVQYLIIKAGQGDYYWQDSSANKLNTAFVNACHTSDSSGHTLKVFGFHYVYGGANDPYNGDTSVSQEIQIATQILATGCDGVVIDAEMEYQDGDPSRVRADGTAPPLAATAAQQYCSGILNQYPSAFLAYAPFFDPNSHTTFPYLTFGHNCAAVIPQDYYRFNGLTPESTVADMDSQWKTLQNSWISSGHSDSVKPIFPAGYSASPASGADITDFVNLLNTDASPATSGGYQGASFYDADHQTSGIWNAIASATIGSTPNPDTTPPTISAFSVTPSSIPVGSSFTASYTVSDGGGSGLKQVVLRRTSGDGSAYDPGWQDIQSITVTGNGPTSGSFNPDTPPSAGTYWYGMAAFDNANNSIDERAAGWGPVQRTVTAPASTISSVTPVPASGANATAGQSFALAVNVSYSFVVGGYLQVWAYDSGFITSVMNGVANAGPQAATVQINLNLPSSAAGQHNYTIYTQFRPGATGGPLLSDGINDIIQSSNYSLNWQNPAPPTPTATAATSVTSGGFTANWSSVIGATGYRLDVSTSSAFGSYVPGYQNLDVGNALNWSVSGLSAGTTYYYQVRAYNGSGASGNSGTISATTAPPSSVTIASSPSGLSMVVDNQSPAITTPATFNWTAGSSHTISATAPQYSADSHTRYSFSSWSDGGAQSHTVTAPSSATTYTASYSTQYLLDTTAAPAGAGAITPSPAGPWYNQGQSVSLTANASQGLTFASWSGADSSSGSTASVTISGYRNVTATFNPVQITITITSAKPGVAGGTFTLSIQTQGGSTYILESKDHLSDSNWTQVQSLTGTGGTTILTDPHASATSRFYRVRAQ